MRWQPNVTVAAIVERDNQFLLVEEEVDGKTYLNQPAGHWEYGETLKDAVIRETLEETGWQFTPREVLGIYHWDHPQKEQTTFLRFAFIGDVSDYDAHYTLDDGIIQPVWMSREAIAKSIIPPRSPQLLRCVDDYLAGNRFDLSLLKHVE